MAVDEEDAEDELVDARVADVQVEGVVADEEDEAQGPALGEGVADDEAYDLGQGAGFYVNATRQPWSKHYHMYDYVTRELPALVERELPLVPGLRAISGHSMGGHGALTLALRHPQLQGDQVEAGDLLGDRVLDLPVDMVLLAVGLVPDPTTQRIAEMIGLAQDDDG